MKDNAHQSRIGIACPHCGGAARIRTSRALSPTYRQLSVGCIDPECGHTFGAELTITHTISPAARPNPNISLRQVPPRRRPANDDQPAAANDERGPGVPRADTG